MLPTWRCDRKQLLPAVSYSPHHKDTMPYVFRQGDLPKLDLQVDCGTDFQAWREHWESYSSLSELDKEPKAKQVKALTLCFSRETLSIVNNLGLTQEQRENANDIITALKRYVDGHVNETVERRNFRRRTQQPGETFDDFLVSLRELAKTCNFCSDTCAQKKTSETRSSTVFLMATQSKTF